MAFNSLRLLCALSVCGGERQLSLHSFQTELLPSHERLMTVLIGVLAWGTVLQLENCLVARLRGR